MARQVPVGDTFALVDEADFDLVSTYTWSLIEWRTCKYAKRRTKDGKTVSMHQFILSTTEEVDHVDGNGLNNTRSNLREVTHAPEPSESKGTGTIQEWISRCWLLSDVRSVDTQEAMAC